MPFPVSVKFSLVMFTLHSQIPMMDWSMLGLVQFFPRAVVLFWFPTSRSAGLYHFTVRFSSQILNLQSMVVSDSSACLPVPRGNKNIIGE